MKSWIVPAVAALAAKLTKEYGLVQPMDMGIKFIGRIYEGHAPFRPELAWFWALHLMGPARGRVRTDGNAATFEEAKENFAASMQAFKAWKGGDAHR